MFKPTTIEDEAVAMSFPDGKTRTWDPVLGCWTRRIPPSPAPPPSMPRIEGGGTPMELAARALSRGDVDLAASYLEQGATA